jgi:hypothetical protein
MNKISIFMVSLLILVVIPSNVYGDEEFQVMPPNYLVGDYFEYSGYTNLVVNDFRNTLENIDENVEIELSEENNELKVNIASIEECELEDFEGFCQRGKTSHFVNLSVTWEHNTTNYLEDHMYVLISTNEETLTPQSYSPWSWTKRSVVITSIFKTENGDEHNVERRITDEFTSHLSDSRPESISVGDSWLSLDTRQLISERAYRENKGLWEKEITNETVQVQRLFTATSYELLSGDTGVIPVITVKEGEAENGNYSLAYLDELGFVRKIENFKNDNLIFSITLEDYRYLRTPDPSAQQSIQWGGVCFGIFIFSSLIFVSIVFVNEYRKQQIQTLNSNEFDQLDSRLEKFKKKKPTIIVEEESDLKIKLRNFYLEHNPAKLEHLAEIITQMEKHSFGDSNEHIEILNAQLRSRYGVDLEGISAEETDEEKLNLPESSIKFKEFMESLLDDD